MEVVENWIKNRFTGREHTSNDGKNPPDSHIFISNKIIIFTICKQKKNKKKKLKKLKKLINLIIVRIFVELLDDLEVNFISNFTWRIHAHQDEFLCMSNFFFAGFSFSGIAQDV